MLQPYHGHQWQLWYFSNTVSGFIRGYAAQDVGTMLAAKRSMEKWTSAMLTSVQLAVAEHMRQEELQLQKEEDH